MSHYPKFNRRPRVHPHSKNYSLPFQVSGEDPSALKGSSFSVSNKTELDRTRSPKVLASFLSIIILGGFINHNFNSISTSFSMKTTEIKTDDNSNNSTLVTQANNAMNKHSQHEYKDMIQGHDGHHFMHGKYVGVAENLTNFADVISPIKSTDVPFFWHIPRSGGSTVKHITAECLGLTQASEVGTVGGHIEDEELIAVHHIQGGKFMNVDTTTMDGLQRAKELDLASFPDLHLVVSPFLLKAAELFDDDHRGRIIIMLRNPIERAVSMYYYLSANDPEGAILDGMSLEQYANSPMVENNWMTRFLSNQMGGELTEEHEAMAREFLRRKCVIGLLSYKTTSLDRFERYFGWKVRGQKMEHCHDQLLNWNWSSKNKHPRIKQGGVVWRSLEESNEFDMRLYNYAVQLFHEQAVLFN